MGCKLCGNEGYFQRDGSVRDNDKLKIYECTSCGLVYLSSLDHIDERFYQNSNMHTEVDLVRWQNETLTDDTRRFKFVQPMITNKTVLDFGSGNGGFLKLAKTVAKNVCAVELEEAVVPLYENESIHLYNNIDKLDRTFDMITAFHVIEHLPKPQEILQKLANHLNENGRIIIEVPNANDALLSIYKSDSFANFTYWSCHLYLYNQHTLSLLAKRAGLKVEFLKHIQRYPLSNHLYWLSKGKPGGHVHWGNFLDSEELSKAYENQLASLGATDTIIAILSKDEV